MSGRTYTASNSTYRFGGSNGQEKDDEIFAGVYSAEYWEYDSRLGRRWNVDPAAATDLLTTNSTVVYDIGSVRYCTWAINKNRSW